MNGTNMDSWKIAGVEIAPGAHEYIKIPVAHMLTGSETGLPLHCVRGEKPGPTLSVLACVHGDEPQPIRAFQNVLAQIDRTQLSGALLVVPVANPFAFAHFSRQSPDQHEQTNLWGAFPGSAKGTLTQRYAHKIREILIEGANYLVECHSGGAAGRIQRRVDMDPGFEGAVGEKSREMAIAFASGGAALVHGVPFSKSSASGYALTQEIPAISVEIGGAYLPECEENLYRGDLEKGFLNLLVHLGMLPGEEKRLRITYFDFAHRAEANPSSGGYLISRKTHFADLGAQVSEGELLGKMLDPFSLEVVEELRSPADGVLFFSRCSGPFEVGNKGFAVATEYREI